MVRHCNKQGNTYKIKKKQWRRDEMTYTDNVPVFQCVWRVSARNKNQPDVFCTLAPAVISSQSVHGLALNMFTGKIDASVVQYTISRVLIKQNALLMNIRHTTL